MRTSFLLELDEAVLMGATMASEWSARRLPCKRSGGKRAETLVAWGGTYGR